MTNDMPNQESRNQWRERIIRDQDDLQERLKVTRALGEQARQEWKRVHQQQREIWEAMPKRHIRGEPFLAMLEGVEAKIRRSQEQLKSLEADLLAFCKAQHTFIKQEVDSQGEEEFWVYHGDKPRVPMEYSVRVGEIAYNWRSALDHLVWQLVLANQEEPGPHNQFPIARNCQAFNDMTSEKTKRGKKKKAYLTGISLFDFHLVENCQPYNGLLPLQKLNDICNIDKHRHLNIVAVGLVDAEVESAEYDGNVSPLSALGTVNFRLLEPGVELARFRPPGKFKFNPRIDVCFTSLDLAYHASTESTTTPTQSDSVKNTLQYCLSAVDSAVQVLKNQES